MEFTFQQARLKERRAPSRTLAFLVLVTLTIAGYLYVASTPSASGGSLTDTLFGNITVIREPVQAIEIAEDFIPVGEANTFIYYLEKGHKYHIYLSGEWADPTTHETDYDIYVYKLIGSAAQLISTHTEAAGLLEQVGNDELGQFFIPDSTRLYYFTIRNDALESSAAEPATLMVLEHIETNTWLDVWMEGKVNEQTVSDTLWSYEFVTSSPRIRVDLRVPISLDMYEARLYVMGNPAAGKGELMEGIPVAWEPGLRGELSGFYGGFNFDPQGFRHVDAMDSCEQNGEDMVIDYEAPVEGELLYHLVLIAEYGVGNLDFMVQTDFEPPEFLLIDPPEIVAAGESITLKVNITDETEIVGISFMYTTDDGESWDSVTMRMEESGTYNVTVPGVDPGVTVEYLFEAEDEMGHKGEIEGSYFAIGESSLELRLIDDEILAGEETMAKGRLNPKGEDVILFFFQGEEIYNFTLTTSDTGRFNQSLKPTSLGNWSVYAMFPENEAYYNSTSETLNFTVSSLATTTTCQVSEESIEAGFGVTLSGEFSLEIPGVTVELIIKTNDEIQKLYAETSANGSYSTPFEPDSKGVWRIKARTFGDGFLYEGSESEWAEFEVVTPGLTTTVTRLPSIVMARVGPFLKPPYLYGVIGIVGIAGGGIVFYLRRRE